MERDVFTVVGFSKGVTKKGDKFTKLALQFESPFPDYQGVDVRSEFIYKDLDVSLGDNVNLVFGCRANGMAFVKDVEVI